MTKPRSSLVSLEDTPWYHVVSRCVRRAFLCGSDSVTGRDFEHRRQWIVDRIKFLSSVFAIDVAGYAVMSNHYHVVMHIDRERALGWSVKEVIKRWSQVSSVPMLAARYVSSQDELGDAEVRRVEELALEYRERLYNLSWFMKSLNEYVARRANSEEGVRGHFWESRYKSQALLDEKALIAAMAYVDLNPVRAGIAATPEESKFTSICERIQEVKSVDLTEDVNGYEGEVSDSKKLNRLMPFDATGDADWAIPFGLEDYLELVDWTGRAIRDDKRGAIDERLPVILERLGIGGDVFIDYAGRFLKEFGCAVGAPKDMVSLCVKRQQKFLKGMRAARDVFKKVA